MSEHSAVPVPAVVGLCLIATTVVSSGMKDKQLGLNLM